MGTQTQPQDTPKCKCQAEEKAEAEFLREKETFTPPPSPAPDMDMDGGDSVSASVGTSSVPESAVPSAVPSAVSVAKSQLRGDKDGDKDGDGNESKAGVKQDQDQDWDSDLGEYALGLEAEDDEDMELFGKAVKEWKDDWRKLSCKRRGNAAAAAERAEQTLAGVAEMEIQTETETPMGGEYVGVKWAGWVADDEMEEEEVEEKDSSDDDEEEESVYDSSSEEESVYPASSSSSSGEEESVYPSSSAEDGTDSELLLRKHMPQESRTATKAERLTAENLRECEGALAVHNTLLEECEREYGRLLKVAKARGKDTERGAAVQGYQSPGGTLVSGKSQSPALGVNEHTKKTPSPPPPPAASRRTRKRTIPCGPCTAAYLNEELRNYSREIEFLVKVLCFTGFQVLVGGAYLAGWLEGISAEQTRWWVGTILLCLNGRG